MRISTQQIFTNAVSQMQQGQSELAQTQERIASGKQLLRPSDDPVAAAQILKLEREISRSDKFDGNIDVSQRRLQLEELTLNQIDTAADRLRELTVQAGSATLSSADRSSIANEVSGLQDMMLSLMNTQDVQGEYLFAGSQGGTQPFVRNNDGSFSYQGDDNQRFIQIGAELQIASTDAGAELFQVIADDIGVRPLGAAADVAALSVSVTDPSDGVFQAFSELNGDVTLNITNISAGVPGSYDYQLLDSAGNSLTGPTTAAVGTPVEFGGLSFDYTGSVPAADLGPVKLRAQQDQHSLLQTAETLITALQTPITDQASRDAFRATLVKVGDELDVAKEGSLKAITQLGSRLNTLDSAREVNADFKLFTETTLSQLEDLDYAAAISEFSLQELALQASQATFSRVSSLSLFNYL